MAARARKNIEADIADVEARMKRHSQVWLDMDKRRSRQHIWSGILFALSLVALAVALDGASGQFQNGVIIGMSVVGFWLFLAARDRVAVVKMDEQNRFRAIAEAKRDELRLALGDAPD